MRLTWALAFLAVLGACGPRQEETERQVPQTLQLTKDIEGNTVAWDVRPGPPSRTIHQPDGCKIVIAKSLEGSIVVDDVILQEADDVMTVTVRVRNTRGGDAPLLCDYALYFYTKNDEMILGYRRARTPFVLEPHGTAELFNSALIRGAARYQLYIDPMTSGTPYD